jgi:gamma-glutamylcyclotransferase (GGCT)/AIG2-like uncharacterized protein YtfP
MYYFAYGSNLSEKRMIEERKIKFLQRKKATLPNFKLIFNKLSKDNPQVAFANIQREEGSLVEGAVYEIENKDSAILDRFEGFPKHYTKEIVRVISEGEEIYAVVYIANPTMTRENLKPTQNYLNYLLEGKDMLSENYYENLSKTETL